MRGIFALAIIVVAIIPQVVMAQTPTADAGIAKSDALWGGTAIATLPDCDGTSVCLASLNQRLLGDEYYYGIVHNPTTETVRIDTLNAIAVTVYAPSGDVAGIAHSVMVTPSILSPQGHAIAMFTIVGDHPREFTYVATFESHVDTGVGEFVRVPIQISHAELRGNGILGQMANTTNTNAEMVAVNGLCLASNGFVLTWFTNMSMDASLAAGESTLFAAEILDDVDCSRYIVIAEGY